MKYTKSVYILIAFLITFSPLKANSLDWGKTGHRTIGKIAEDYLKGKTKRKIAALLDGKSLALVSNFGDEIRADKRYNEFSTWHYVNMPFGVTYKDSEKNPKGDVIAGIEKCKQVLLDKNATREDKVFYLKMLVHLVGDLHQPMHVGRKEDKGGNTIQVQWFNRGTNLHRVWDTNMINHYGMGYTELANSMGKISKDQVKYLQKGSVEDWANSIQKSAIKVYASVAVGENLRHKYMYDNFALVRSQLQKGGIRLAKILNDIFK